MTVLFIAMSSYLQPSTQLAEALPEHRAWIRELYESGVMLASGRRNPPIGGVMILRAVDASEAAAVVASDPFAAKGLAAYDIHQFEPTPMPWRSAGLEAFLTDS